MFESERREIIQFIEGQGSFDYGKTFAGMAGSQYPKAFVEFIRNSPSDKQERLASAILSMSLEDGEAVKPGYQVISANLLLNLCLRGLKKQFEPHVDRVRTRLELSIEEKAWEQPDGDEAAWRFPLALLMTMFVLADDSAEKLRQNLLVESRNESFRHSLVQLPAVLLALQKVSGG